MASEAVAITLEWKRTNFWLDFKLRNAGKCFSEICQVLRGRGEIELFLVSLHSQLGYFRELPGADMQRGLWLQSLQRKYINTKPLASLFSLVNISNTPRSGSCFQSPLCNSNVDVVFLTVLGQTAAPQLESPRHPSKMAAQTHTSQAEHNLLWPAICIWPSAQQSHKHRFQCQQRVERIQTQRW